MRVLDYTCDSPAGNLALEEAILNAVETGASPDTLRFWESPAYFAVLGVGQVLADEVFESACAADGVPVLRRCTAGGCVLQGPGCLNYSLFLTYAQYPEIRQLRPSYCYILTAIADQLRALGIDARVQGTSDLAVSGKKFSGNAQKRKKHAILHHGTLLYGLDADRLPRYLREPAQRPDYRGQRVHAEFVQPIALDSDILRRAVREAFSARSDVVPPTGRELEESALLHAEKYGQTAWTRRR